MPCRPPHGSPDVEAALARLEEIGGFKIEVRREGQIYAVLRYRPDEPVCASMNIWETPRDSLICAQKIIKFGEIHLEFRDVDLEGLQDAGQDEGSRESVGPKTRSDAERAKYK